MLGKMADGVQRADKSCASRLHSRTIGCGLATAAIV